MGWGYDGDGQISGIPSGSDFIAVASGAGHGIALKSDHTIVAWGRNIDHPDKKWVGQAVAPQGNDFRVIAGGAWHSLAIKEDGSIFAWGSNDCGESSPPPGHSQDHFQAIAGGTRWSLALRDDGTLVAWGGDDYGQVSNAPTGSGYIAIVAGVWHGLALKNDGSIVAWGRDAEGQVRNTPTGGGFKAIASHLYTNYALRSDGSIAAWGWDAYGQVSNTPNESGFIAIDSGDATGYALRIDGSIAAWGIDEWGELSNKPADKGFIAIAAGAGHCYALKPSPNSAPTANAGPDQTIECACQRGGTKVALNGTGSSDPDGDPLTYTWTGPFAGSPVHGSNPTVALVPGCLGSYVITLIVNDGHQNSSPDTMQVTVRDTTAPDITCPASITVEAKSASGVPTTDPAIVAFLAGASASDNCDPHPVITNNAPAQFPMGETKVTFTATDRSSNVSTGEATVKVQDTTPPTISKVTALPNTLWPANHKMVAVGVRVEATDLCDPSPKSRIVDVTCNEPVNGPGDGNTQPDWEIVGDLTVMLRAERSGSQEDRIYTIHVESKDSSGNITAGTVVVTVPHDQGKKK